MKAILAAFALVFLAATGSPVSAQGNAADGTDLQALRAAVKVDRKAFVASTLQLTDAEAKKFWPLYEKFQRELDVPHREYALAVRDYVAAENAMTDANAARLTRSVLAASVTESKMREKHFKEVSKVLPGIKAARYIQIENKIQAIQRYETAKAIPLAH